MGNSPPEKVRAVFILIIFAFILCGGDLDRNLSRAKPLFMQLLE
jgi:hypothetical protein